ncbi:Rab GTPase-binding exocyst subunit SEC15 NDAI_0I03170 [Naumovozyma dairenensis CBS 421]|uniref:Exocyst complex component SEC15 n=1 Tax=Naumovozyma dairenensis (strain ATCC 10597 / BCRC 20456 / CBS 421 / NBRC 0211 / NRRL Y-12639) TaxID=1071378 RepID=G0WGH4_NAUDC|nr:hypothetical protein NDAI_0I03170 [Naumovozyma dairenensis CBS 421]CCD26885.1 hypothetical protein NDAI_0I03170 [Naumovozyma dairenensis CBS 421]
MEQEVLLSQEFQKVLLASEPKKKSISSSISSTQDEHGKSNITNGVDFGTQDDAFELDPQSFDKWVPFLRNAVENDQLNAIIQELDTSIDDNFQGLELQLLQDSQINDKLESSVNEISNIQNTIDSSLSKGMAELQEQLSQTTNDLIVKKQIFVNNKKTSMKISEAIILITKVIRILSLSSKCQELIVEGNFFKALQNLDNLEKLYLQEFRNYNFQFLKEIYESIPYLKSVTKDECLNLIRNSLNSNLGKNLTTVGEKFITTYQSDLLIDWMEKKKSMNLESFKFNSPVEISMRDQTILQTLNLDNFFHIEEFYDSIMIFQSLNELDYLFTEFSKEYEFRKSKIIYPLLWKRTSNSKTNVIPGDISTDTFTKQMNMTFLKEYLWKILGFLLYDINLHKSTDFVLVDNNYNATNDFWDGLMSRLLPYIRHFIRTGLTTDKDWIEFKDFLCIYVAILENYKLNIEPLYSILILLFESYCDISIKAFDDEFEILLNDDDFMPLTINDKSLFEKVAQICWMKDDENIKPTIDNENTGEFMVTLPFSPLYPMTCTLTKKTYSKLSSFVTIFYRHQLHTLNKLMVKTIDRIFTDVVNKKIRSKLESTSREEIAQILINLDYFIIAAKSFSKFMTRDNLMQNPDIEIKLSSIKNYSESRKLAETKLINLIDSKVSDIMETVDLDWTSNTIRQDPDISIVDLAQFLEMMFASTLVNLPYSVQILLIFREFDSLTKRFLDILLHDTPDLITKISILNFEVDIKYLEGIIPKIFPNHDGSGNMDFVETSSNFPTPMTPMSPTFNHSSEKHSPELIENNVKSLEETFIELKQYIDLLKSDNLAEYMMDPEVRNRKYPRVKFDNANLLIHKIEKSQNLLDSANTDDQADDNSSVFTRDFIGNNSSSSKIAKFFNRR